MMSIEEAGVFHREDELLKVTTDGRVSTRIERPDGKMSPFSVTQDFTWSKTLMS